MRRNRIVKSQGTVQQPALNLTAVGHLAQGRSVQRGRHVRVDGFHRRQNRHLRKLDAQDVRQVNGVLHNVNFVHQAGPDVQGSVSHHQGLGVHRHIKTKDMRHAPAGAQTGLGQDRMQQFVGVQTALHEDFHMPLGRHLSGHVSGSVAVRHVDTLHAAQIQARVQGDLVDLGGRANQHRNDQAVARSVQRAAQRFGVTRMDHGAAHRLHALAPSQQGIESGFGIKQLNVRHRGARAAHLLRWRQHTGRAIQHTLGVLIGHVTVQIHFLLRIVQYGDGDGDRQGIANAHRT